MRTELTLPELDAQIKDRGTRKMDMIADTRHLDIEHDPKSTLGWVLNVRDGKGYDVTDHTHGQIAARHGIPWSYYQMMRTEQPGLLETNINTWFQNKPRKQMLRTLDSTARAYLSNSYARMDDDVFAEIVLQAMADVPGMKVVSTAITEERTHIKIVSEKIEREIKVGDPVQFGLAFSNSEIGLGRLAGSLLVYRLVCLNGAVSPEDAFAATHLGKRQGADHEGIYALDTVAADAKATILKLRDYAKELLSERRIDAVVAKMKGLMSIPLASPAEAVQVLGKSHSLTENERGSILTHLIKGGDPTMWGLMNAVTASAQDPGLTYARATDLEQIGGKIMTLPATSYRILAEAA